MKHHLSPICLQFQNKNKKRQKGTGKIELIKALEMLNLRDVKKTLTKTKMVLFRNRNQQVVGSSPIAGSIHLKAPGLSVWEGLVFSFITRI